MNVGGLFLRFKGRIGRVQYWVGTFAVVVLVILLAALLQSILGVSLTMGPFRSRWPALVIELIGMYPLTAVAAKRLHDRDKSGTTAGWLIVVVAILTASDVYGFYSAKALVISTVVLLYFVIDLGVLRGAAGPNRYGPAPLGRAA